MTNIVSGLEVASALSSTSALHTTVGIYTANIFVQQKLLELLVLLSSNLQKKHASYLKPKFVKLHISRPETKTGYSIKVHV